MNSEHFNIVISDIQLHSVIPRKPIPWYRAVTKAFKNKLFGKTSRFYTTYQTRLEDGLIKVSFTLPPKIKKEKEEAEKSGKTIRLIYPPNGIPMILAKDAIEKLQSEARKGFIK